MRSSRSAWSSALERLGTSRLVAIVARVMPPAVAAGIGAYQLSLSNVLFGVYDYDDGVYIGTADRFVHGVLPYRDFVYLHPPGFVVLLAPIALVGRAIGTRDALAIARCLTVLVTIANVALVQRLVRHAGRVAMLTTGLALACFPLAVNADNTVLLEPFLALACITGALTCLQHGRLIGGRRAVLGGIFFGLAVTIKLWALVPLAALVAVALASNRRAVRPISLGAVGACATVCLPFVVGAPGAFFHDVVVTQLARTVPSAISVARSARLINLTGLYALYPDHQSPALALALFLAFAAVVTASAVAVRQTPALAWFCTLSWAAMSIAVLSTAEFYGYYAYFPAVFAAPAAGLVAASIWRRVGRPSESSRRPDTFPFVRVCVGALLALSIAIVVVPIDVHYARGVIEASSPFDAAAPAPPIPNGSCVLYAQASVGLDIDRFDPAAAGCPAMVDPYGSWLAADPAHPPPSAGPFDPALVQSWIEWMARADYLVLASAPEQSRFVPFAPGLRRELSANYRLVWAKAGELVYENVARASS